MSDEKSLWMRTTSVLNEGHTSELGPYFSYYLKTDPKHIAFTLSRYKFATKMLPDNCSVIEFGCSDGIGTLLFKEKASKVIGIDFDQRSIDWATKNISSDHISFISDDLIDMQHGQHDAVVSLDVIEHIYPKNEKAFVESVIRHLKPTGMAIIGTPNITAEQYATKNEQHVNMYSGERLKSTFEQYFHNVFLFGMNDEVLHTGFTQMCHYLFVLCCSPKSSTQE